MSLTASFDHEAATAYPHSLDRMAAIACRSKAGGMRSALRDEIYDAACEFVEATARMRRAAATLEDPQLAPALLACIEAALDDLAWTASALEDTSLRRTTEHPRADAMVVERMRRGWANLRETLVDAERAAAATRALVARASRRPLCSNAMPPTSTGTR